MFTHRVKKGIKICFEYVGCYLNLSLARIPLAVIRFCFLKGIYDFVEWLMFNKKLLNICCSFLVQFLCPHSRIGIDFS